MRTTVNLDDDVMRAVRSLAREKGESLGTVISSLVRDALRPPDTLEYEMDVPVFRVREGAAPITPEMVQSALEE
ncbi:MAG: antitoxin [Gemmatimonadota bacterium]